MHKALVLAVAILAWAGCNKDSKSDAACDKYAKMEIECKGAGEGARTMIVKVCGKARAGAKDIMSQLVALETSCAETATDCTAYKACVEQKKHDTTPTP